MSVSTSQLIEHMEKTCEFRENGRVAFIPELPEANAADIGDALDVFFQNKCQDAMVIVIPVAKWENMAVLGDCKYTSFLTGKARQTYAFGFQELEELKDKVMIPEGYEGNFIWKQDVPVDEIMAYISKFLNSGKVTVADIIEYLKSNTETMCDGRLLVIKSWPNEMFYQTATLATRQLLMDHQKVECVLIPNFSLENKDVYHWNLMGIREQHTHQYSETIGDTRFITPFRQMVFWKNEEDLDRAIRETCAIFKPACVN